MRFSAISVLASVFALANAHFTLNYPQTRGFDEDTETNFCGGFNTPSANRSAFPLNDGWIAITSAHPKSTYIVTLSFDANPQSLNDFNKTILHNFTNLVKSGDACIPVNVGATAGSQAKNGTNATILVQFDGGDGNLFQCADVVLSDKATPPNNATCHNDTAIFATDASGAVQVNIMPALLAGGASLAAAAISLF